MKTAREVKVISTRYIFEFEEKLQKEIELMGTKYGCVEVQIGSSVADYYVALVIGNAFYD